MRVGVRIEQGSGLTKQIVKTTELGHSESNPLNSLIAFQEIKTDIGTIYLTPEGLSNISQVRTAIHLYAQAYDPATESIRRIRKHEINHKQGVLSRVLFGEEPPAYALPEGITLLGEGAEANVYLHQDLPRVVLREQTTSEKNNKNRTPQDRIIATELIRQAVSDLSTEARTHPEKIPLDSYVKVPKIYGYLEKKDSRGNITTYYLMEQMKGRPVLEYFSPSHIVRGKTLGLIGLRFEISKIKRLINNKLREYRVLESSSGHWVPVQLTDFDVHNVLVEFSNETGNKPYTLSIIDQ